MRRDVGGIRGEGIGMPLNSGGLKARWGTDEGKELLQKVYTALQGRASCTDILADFQRLMCFWMMRGTQEVTRHARHQVPSETRRLLVYPHRPPKFWGLGGKKFLHSLKTSDFGSKVAHASRQRHVPV